MTRIDVVDLAGVVYSSGKVFDGLATGRLDTENFLRSGSLTGVTSRSDLALLEDLRDAAQFIIDHRGGTVDAAFVQSVNQQLTRSAALHPGQLRTADQQIGVKTRYGRHEPTAMTDRDLQRLLDRTLRSDDVIENALDVFVELSKAQPFEDGNKRTAIFVANKVLLDADVDTLLVVPVDEDDPSLANRFNDCLALAYIRDERDGVKELLRSHGLTALDDRRK
ncbi:Fic family protein [Nocardia sp. NPDC058658]|uniref:Fic family protein n=1 Tax=Nocardia sp. NPDC058658 TaxID=3346580 RepID=UPI00365D711F